MYNKAVKVYTFIIPANGAFPLLVQSDYFRLQSATGAVDVNGDTFGTLPDLLTGQGLENTPYKRLTFTDKTGAPNTVSVLCSGDLFIDNRTYGVVTVSNAIALDAASLNALNRPELYTASGSSVALLAANASEVVVAPGVNVAGVVVQHFEVIHQSPTGNVLGALLAKATAPASFVDGVPLVGLRTVGVGAGTLYYRADILKDVVVPAGLGVYWNQNEGTNANGSRQWRVRIL